MKHYLFWTASILILIFVGQVKAEWSEPKLADDGSYFVGTDSTRFENSFLAIYALPKFDCRLMAVNLFMVEKPLEAVDAEIPLRVRIDSNPVQYVDGFNTVVPEEDSSTIRMGFPLTNQLVKELAAGNKLIFDDNVGDEKMDTDEFSLSGSALAIMLVTQACHEHTNDEWAPAPQLGEDEWRS